MPKPKKGESKKEFISRCMGYDDMQKYDQDQRLAICYSYWEEKKEQTMKNKEIKEKFKQENMPRDLKEYLQDYIEEYFMNTDRVISGISLGAIGLYPGKGAFLESPKIETEDGWQYIRENSNENVIEITENIEIKQDEQIIILEKGDKIKIYGK